MAKSLTDAENRYSGIPTIRREMAAYGLPEPVFENRRDEFVVTLYNTTADYSAGRQSADAEKNLPVFCEKPRSRQEITDYLGLKTSYYAMQKYIVPLLDSGELKMTDPDHPGSRKQKYYSKNKSS